MGTENLILTQIPESDLLNKIRIIVQEELLKSQGGVQKPSGSIKYLTSSEVAKQFSVSLPTITAWTRSGRLTAYRISRRVFYKSSEVDQALNSIKTAPVSAKKKFNRQ